MLHHKCIYTGHADVFFVWLHVVCGLQPHMLRTADESAKKLFWNENTASEELLTQEKQGQRQQIRQATFRVLQHEQQNNNRAVWGNSLNWRERWQPWSKMGCLMKDLPELWAIFVGSVVLKRLIRRRMWQRHCWFWPFNGLDDKYLQIRTAATHLIIPNNQAEHVSLPW